MPIKRVIAKKRASLLAAAAAAAFVGGIAVTPASATVTPASSCSPKTDYQYNATHWSNWCGTGYRYYFGLIIKVRDATYPYHRIWIHTTDGQSWCAWGPADQTVPGEFNGTRGNIANELISDNTSSC